jgi:hypothetical protein
MKSTIEGVIYKVQYSNGNCRCNGNCRKTSHFATEDMAKDYYEEKIESGRKRVTLSKVTKLTLEEKIL